MAFELTIMDTYIHIYTQRIFILMSILILTKLKIILIKHFFFKEKKSTLSQHVILMGFIQYMYLNLSNMEPDGEIGAC